MFCDWFMLCFCLVRRLFTDLIKCTSSREVGVYGALF